MRKAERKLDTPPPECVSAAMPYLLSWSAAVRIRVKYENTSTHSTLFFKQDK